MLVSSSSPAPSSTIFRAHSTASRPVALRPPWVKISQRGSSPSALTCLASMATTMHWLPKRSAASRTNSGLNTAAVLIETLSAPALSSFRMSSTVRTPPPTVSGMKTSAAIRSTVSYVVSRLSWLAVMSRKVISSAPCSLYLRAISTGSPASRMSTKLTPLTTRPLSTSRQGMIRFASVIAVSSGGFQAVAVGLGFGYVEGALVNGPTGDGADDALVGHFRQLLQVIHIGNATGGDDRDASFLGQCCGRFDVDSLHHAVAADVGVYDGFDTVVGETFEIGRASCRERV